MVQAYVDEAQELGVDPDVLNELRQWGYRDHKHYSLNVRRLVLKFQLSYVRYRKICKVEDHNTLERGIRAQEYWQSLLKARIEETGVAYYLDEQSYARQVSKHKAKSA